MIIFNKVPDGALPMYSAGPSIAELYFYDFDNCIWKDFLYPAYKMKNGMFAAKTYEFDLNNDICLSLKQICNNFMINNKKPCADFIITVKFFEEHTLIGLSCRIDKMQQRINQLNFKK